MANSKIFAEYITSKYHDVNFTNVPINPAVNFHFICAFAIDCYATTPPTPTNGRFNVHWNNQRLSPASISAIKQSHPNVRVFAGLGGASIVNDNNLVYFEPNPVDTDSWVSNAVNSLTTIIREYKLDGIDIDYESFKSDTNTFTKCIGQLIRTLKQTGVIQFASIAPYNDPTVQEKYQALWREHGDFIDYVNFQFYAYPQILNVEQYVQYYDSQMANYPGANVLASFSTGNEVNRIDICLNACESLNMQGKLNGIFNWSADNSLLHNRFNYEEQAQEILAGPN